MACRLHRLAADQPAGKRRSELPLPALGPTCYRKTASFVGLHKGCLKIQGARKNRNAPSLFKDVRA